jgi:DNA polymerase-3 subunit alpha
VQPDRFAGGLRLNVNAVWDLAGARARFGNHLSVRAAEIRGGSAPLTELVRTWPARRIESEAGELVQGLRVRLKLRRPEATADVDLGETSRFWPSDEALLRWKQLSGGNVDVVYEGGG